MAAQTSAPMMAFGYHPWGQSPKQEGSRTKKFSLVHHNPGFKNMRPQKNTQLLKNIQTVGDVD